MLYFCTYSFIFCGLRKPIILAGTGFKGQVFLKRDICVWWAWRDEAGKQPWCITVFPQWKRIVLGAACECWTSPSKKKGGRQFLRLRQKGKQGSMFPVFHKHPRNKPLAQPQCAFFAFFSPALPGNSSGAAPTSATANSSHSSAAPKPFSLSFSTTPNAPNEGKWVVLVAALAEKTSNFYSPS